MNIQVPKSIVHLLCFLLIFTGASLAHQMMGLQTETVDLSDQKSRSDGSRKYFRESNIESYRSIDSDGLPCVGQVSIHVLEFYFLVYIILFRIVLNPYSWDHGNWK